MSDSIQTLADIVGGQLRLAAMPPLGGVWEPIGRIVTSAEHVTAGDVLIVSADEQRRQPWSVAQAFERGAIGIIHGGGQIEPMPGRFCLRVEDVSWAKWQLARTARNEFNGRVIAVAGAIGKSLTCALIQAVLDHPLQAVADDDAEPDQRLTGQMLSWDNDAAYAAVELHHGDAQQLDASAHLACPDIGVIVNTHGPAAALGDGTYRTPRQHDWQSLLAALPDDGCAILPADAAQRPGSFDRSSGRACRTITFGRRGDADVSATHVLCQPGRLSFAVDGQRVHLNVWGRHHLSNALAAWCVGRAAGIPERQIGARLAQATLPSHRCHVSQHRLPAGGVFTSIDDTASRSPHARLAGLDLLSWLPARRRTVVCAAPQQQRDANFRWGQAMIERGSADALFALGAGAADVLRGAIDAGMPRTHCHRCAGSEQLIQQISTFLDSDDVLLHSGVDAHTPQRLLALFTNTTEMNAPTSSESFSKSTAHAAVHRPAA